MMLPIQVVNLTRMALIWEEKKKEERGKEEQLTLVRRSQLGNPLGGLVYSTGLVKGNNTTLTQVVEWNQFLDGTIL